MRKKNNFKKWFLIIVFVLILSCALFYFFGRGKVSIGGGKGALVAPSGIKVSDESGQMLISWKDNSQNENGFSVKRTSDIVNNDFEEITKTKENVANFTDTNVEPGQRYWYKVCAYNNDNTSSFTLVGTIQSLENKNYLQNIGSFNSEDNSTGVASGWTKRSNLSKDSVEYRVQRSLKNDSTSSQYFGMKGPISASENVVGLSTDQIANISNSSEYNIHTGDTLSLSLSKYYMINSQDNGIEYSISIDFLASNGDLISSKKFVLPLTIAEKPLIFSTAPKDDFLIPNNTYKVVVNLLMKSNAEIQSGRSVGIYVSDLKLNLKRNGDSEYEKVMVPANRDREILTQRVSFDPKNDDIYESAEKYDIVTGKVSQYNQILTLRYYNPNIKILGYTTFDMIDARQSDFSDPEVSDSPVPFGWALDQQKKLSSDDQWFYQFPLNTTTLQAYGDKRSSIENASMKKYENDGVTPISYVFYPTSQTRYPVNFKSVSYKDAWVDNTVRTFSKYRFDGMFLDDIVTSTVEGTKTDPVTGERSTVLLVDADQDLIVNFSKDVIAKVTERLPQFNVVHNASSKYFDESSNIINKEIKLENGYDLHDWLSAIESIDKLKAVNESTSSNLKSKYVHETFRIVGDKDNLSLLSSKQSDNLDLYNTSWARFSLASYLLSSNFYSAYGVEKSEGGSDYSQSLDPGFGLSSQIGQADGARMVNYQGKEYNATDSFLNSDDKKTTQFRKYSNGLVIVNGSLTETWTFTLDSNYIDEFGRSYQKDSTIKLFPHTGRILFKWPRATLTVAGDPMSVNSVYNQTLKISLKAEDYDGKLVDKIFYQIDDNPEQKYDSEFEITNGVHKLKYYAVNGQNDFGMIENRIFYVNSGALDAPKLYSLKEVTFESNMQLDISTGEGAEKVVIEGSNQFCVVLNSSCSMQVALAMGKNSFGLKSMGSNGNESALTSIVINRYKPGDTNGDNVVDSKDFSFMMSNWGVGKNYLADFNNDGRSDIKDFSIFTANWGK